jgi:hypothetical protein
MKNLMLPVIVGALFLFVAACASESEKKNGESRIGGRVGVTVGSRDVSRIAPSRPDLQPPAN